MAATGISSDDRDTLLAIETAGSSCSAAVLRGGAILAVARRPLRHGHAEVLMPMIAGVMARAGLPPRELTAVAAAAGPGGFTGIRVGLAAGRGIALAAAARLVGVTGFAAVAAGLTQAGVAGDWHGCCRVLVALDSRRADLYVQLFARDPLRPLAEPRALLPDAVAGYVAACGQPERLLVAGDAAAAAAAALDPAAVVVADGAVPDALGVAAAAQAELRRGAAAGLVRPHYLRPPDITLAAPHRPQVRMP